MRGGLQVWLAVSPVSLPRKWFAMPPDAPSTTASFEDLLVVELKAWNWNLHVGLSSDLSPPDQRFQGGLSYIRSFEIQGLILAPGSLRSKSIRIWTSTFGPELQFGSDDDAGQV